MAFNNNNGLPSNETFGITTDDENNVWVSTWEGIAKFDGSTWSVPFQAQDSTIFNNHVHDIEFDLAGNIWVGHINNGISQFRFADRQWVKHDSKNGLGYDLVRDIEIQPADDLSSESIWVATEGGGISHYQHGQWHIYTQDNGLPSNEVSDIEIDKYNRVWAATLGGVVYFDGEGWTQYNQLPTLSIAFGPNCEECPWNDEHVWAGTDGFGITHSRLPYPDEAIKIEKACFAVIGRELECQFAPELEAIDVITFTYPNVLRSGQEMRFEITATPQEPYELRQDRGDFLSNVDPQDEFLYGAYPIVPALETTESNESYTFTDFDNPFQVDLPDGVEEKTFVSSWRVWMHTRYAGPEIRLQFTVVADTSP